MKINENLVLDSGKELKGDRYFVGFYTMSEEWIPGQIYTLSFDIVDFKGGDIRGYMYSGTYCGTITNPAKNVKRYSGSFTCLAPPEGLGKVYLKRLGFFNFPNGNHERYTRIKNVKLEKGTEATLYIPNKADLKDSSLYPTKVGGVSNGRKYIIFRGCILC